MRSNGSLTFSVVLIWITLLFSMWCIRLSIDELKDRLKKLESAHSQEAK